MPDSPLLPLTTASAFSGGEAFYTVQGGNDRKALSSQFYQYITTISTLGSTPAALTIVSDANVLLSATGNSSTALLQPITLTTSWAGTLSSGRLNANVVQTVTNDSNVTGAISSQNLQLGWTGVLPSSRIGTIGSSQVTGAATLGPFNSSQVVFANSSNTVTGNDVFTWNNTANRLTVGASTPITIDFTQSALQVVSSGVNNWGQSWLQYDSVLGGGVELAFAHSRSSTAYGVTALTSTDNMLQFRVYGTDGATYVPSARLEANVDDSVSANIVPSRWAFYTQPTTGGSILERMRIDNAGRVVIGGVAGQAIPDNEALQVLGTTFATAGGTFARWANSATSVSNIVLAKSRGTVISSHAIVSSGDNVGRIIFRGDDGVNFIDGAYIQVDVADTTGVNNMPMQIAFHTTPEAASFPIQRLIVQSCGHVVVSSSVVVRFQNDGWVVNDTAGGATPIFTFGGSFSQTSILQAHGHDTNAGLTLGRWQAGNVNPAKLIFFKSRGTATSSLAPLIGGDLTGYMGFNGTDGFSQYGCAEIYSTVTTVGTSISGGVSGDLWFTTSPNTFPNQRMRIDSLGNTWLFNTNSSTPAVNTFGAVANVNGIAAEYAHAAYGGV